jgi:hypothetical protein
MFWIALGAFIFGSVMCWSAECRKIVVLFWVLGIAAFFGLPIITANTFALVLALALMSIVMLLCWKVETA